MRPKDHKQSSPLELRTLDQLRRPAVAIVQSCYVPWKGYFDLLNTVDHLIIYDDVQYVKRHWHNRNQIKTAQGLKWISIPVCTKSKFNQSIEDTVVSEPWAERHWRSIEHNYARATHFDLYRDTFRTLYERAGAINHLSEINALFLQHIAEMLGVTTTLSWSRDHCAQGAKTDRLLSICTSVGARSYVSGPSAKAYFEADKFDAAGIDYDWMDYGGYPHYSQLHGKFEHAVSVLDLIFNAGPEAPLYMKSFPPPTNQERNADGL